MSLLPPPPAAPQQRRPVRSIASATAAPPPSASRGLYSDAVGLRTGLSADALRHPISSVGLHDGPKFVPQHRPVAQHAPLDIGAMVAARLSLPEPEVDTAGGEKKYMFMYGKKKKGEGDGPGALPSLEKQGSSMLDKAGSALQGAKASMKDQWAAANKEDAITGMDKYDYTFIASTDSFKASMVMSMQSKSKRKALMAAVGTGTTEKEDVDVKFGPDEVRAAMFPDIKTSDPKKGSIALLATIDKTWDEKEQAFKIQSAQDKIKTFDATDTYRILPARDLNNSLVVKAIRDYWATTAHAKGIVDPKDDKTFSDYPKRVAALQDEAKEHIERVPSRVIGAKEDQWAPNSPHPLSMGQAAMVAITDETRPAHIDALVGEPFLSYLKNTYMKAGRNKRPNKDPEVVNPDSNTPYIIPIGSRYNRKEKPSPAYTTLKEAHLEPDDDLHCVNALLVVKLPAKSDARLRDAFGLAQGAKINVEWSRIAPHQECHANDDVKEEFTDTYQDTYLNASKAVEMNDLMAEKKQLEENNERKKNQQLPDDKKEKLEQLLTDAMNAYKTNSKATWKETIEGFEEKNHIAIYGLHLDYQCFEDAEKPVEQCAGKGLLISKHPLFIRPFGGSDVEPEQAASPKDLMRIWTMDADGEGKSKLVNALPLALKGKGIDCRFLWAALKLAQRSFRTAKGKAKPGVKQVLNMKGGKITTATRAKHRWLHGLQDTTLSRGMTNASFEGDYDDVFVGCCFSDDEEE